MKLLEDLSTYLSAQGLTTGWLTCLEAFSDQPDKALCIYEYGSAYPHQAVPGSTRQLQIVVRAARVVEAREKAFEVFQHLHNVSERTQLTDTRWAQLTANKAPIKLKVDTQNRTYYVFNFVCTTSKI